MAFSQHHHTPSRQCSVAGTGSSHCCLDGVPFKISTIFRPLPQPSLPSELMRDVPRCDALHEEYDYETEEGVLAWSRAREEAKVKAQEEKEIAERTRATLAAAESSSSSDSEDIWGPPQLPPSADTAREAVALPQQQQQQQPGVTPPWRLPLAASMGSTILKPMPFQTTKTKVQSPMAPKAQVDLAMFEQERDPFDNLELQTIDDMEELRALLERISQPEATTQETSPNPETQVVYSNSEMVNSQIRGGSQSEAAGGGVVGSSGDNVYVNVSVRPGVEVGSSEQTHSGECNGDSVATLGGSGISSSMCRAEVPSNPNPDFAVEPTGDGDYVMIRSDYSQRSVTFQEDLVPMYVNVGPGKDSSNTQEEEELQELYTNSEVFNPTQPPVLPRVQSLGGERGSISAVGKTTSIVFNPAVRYSLPRTSGHVDGLGSRMTQSAYLWSESSTGAWDLNPSRFAGKDDNHTYSNFPGSDTKSIMTASTPAFSNMFYSSATNSEPTSVNPQKRTVDVDNLDFTPTETDDTHTYSNVPYSDINSIMTVSMPAFSNCFYDCSIRRESDSAAPANITSPNGAALRNAKSNPDLSAKAHTTDPMSHSSPQPWNPYKPLPPTPVSDLRSSSSSTESLLTDPCQNLSPLLLSPCEVGAAASSEESDPYHRLSSDAKTFVNHLTSMGFSRSRASRAVEKFGADEREVLDHMFNVDKLVEKKFAPALAETGLQLFKNDIRKAEQFLDLFQQFKELGFTSERIQAALVKHELDRDKALDFLTT